jgi:hypothetical protein
MKYDSDNIMLIRDINSINCSLWKPSVYNGEKYINNFLSRHHIKIGVTFKLLLEPVL